MLDALWLLGFFAVVGGLLYASYKIEPHWVSKDGRRFLCNAQSVTEHGATLGAWREYRVEVLDDGRLFARRRSRLFPNAARMWVVAAKSESPPKRREVYLLESETPGEDDMLAIRLPVGSKAIPILDALLT